MQLLLHDYSVVTVWLPMVTAWFLCGYCVNAELLPCFRSFLHQREVDCPPSLPAADLHQTASLLLCVGNVQ